MFARILTVDLKPGTGTEWAKTIEEVVALMRTCAGFRDQIAMVSTDGKQAVGISFWDNAESAEAYNRDTFPRIIKIMEPSFARKPVVVTYNVTNSTAHHLRSATA